MRIIFIGSTVDRETLKKLPDASVAGNKMQLGFIKGFIKNGIDTVVISVEPQAMWKFNKKPIIVKSKKLNDEQVNLCTVSYINIPVIKQISIYRAIKKRLKKERINEETVLVVYNTMSIFALPVLKAAKKYNCKCAAIIADLPIKFKKNVFRRIEDKRQIDYIPKFDAIIPLTEHIAIDFAQDKPYCVVEAGCDARDCNKVIAEKKNDEKKHIVFSGTLNQLSGIDLIINAMSYVNPNIVLDIYGKGEQVGFIKEKESQNIIYHGFVTNDEIMKIQAKSDLLVCPRHFDEFTTKYTFPSKLLEYIIAGVPVLSNKLKGIPQEYEKYVTLSEYDDPLTWAKYINEILIDNPEKYKQKAIWALKECSEKKSWENQTEKVITLFNQVGENND